MSDALVEALATELGALLSARHWRVSAAESCTGGLVAAAITSVAGSSGWFDAGFVTYADAAKHEMLGVSSLVLAEHGAVSEPTACAMATGALHASGADIAVAITGVAGPGGGSASKPVGMVCLAWAWSGDRVESTVRYFGGSRAAIRHASVVAALEGLIERARA